MPQTAEAKVAALNILDDIKKTYPGLEATGQSSSHHRIPLPMSLDLIKKRLESRYYAGPESFVQDLQTLFTNGGISAILPNSECGALLQRLAPIQEHIALSWHKKE